MFEQWDKSISFLKALILHILLLGLIFFFSTEKEQRQKFVAPENIVQAVAIDENQLLAAQRQKEAELERQKAEQERLEALKRKRIAEVKLREQKEEEAKRKAEERRKAELKRKAEKKRKAEQRRKAEKKRKAEERRKAEKKRKAEERRKAEKRRKAEQRRKAEKRRKAEEKRKAAEKIRQAEEKRKAAEKKRKAEERARQLAEEKRQAEEAARYQAEKLKKTQKVIGRIAAQVTQIWMRPRGYYTGLSCVIEIQLKGGGAVKTAKIISSSGNSIFDISAVKAVYDASPLPIPYDVYDEFRKFNFRFSPN